MNKGQNMAHKNYTKKPVYISPDLAHEIVEILERVSIVLWTESRLDDLSIVNQCKEEFKKKHRGVAYL